jgi:hypothetical protein
MPQIFCDGTSVYKKITDKYNTHKKGLFIVAPSGTGKTHFINNQKTNDWIDGDMIWNATGAHPPRAWWKEGLDVITEIDQKSDIITSECKKIGLWIMGASNAWLVPDAIVIPHWHTHKKYINHREKNNYDGGATSADFDQVLGHRKALVRHAKKNKVRIFKTIQEAVTFLTTTNK